MRDLGGGALFLADHADALAAEAAEAADQRLVLAELAVARERREFRDQRGDEVGEMRTLMDAAPPASSATASAWRRGPRAPARPSPRSAKSLRRCRCRWRPARAIRRPWRRARRPAFRSRDSCCACDPASRQYKDERARARSGIRSREESTHLQLFSVHSCSNWAPFCEEGASRSRAGGAVSVAKPSKSRRGAEAISALPGGEVNDLLLLAPADAGRGPGS